MDENRGYSIFRILNGRGKSLRESDHLKSELMKKLRELNEEYAKEAAEKWQQYESLLNRGQFENALEVFQMIQKGRQGETPSRVHVRELAQEFHQLGVATFQAYLADFWDFFDMYHRLVNQKCFESVAEGQRHGHERDLRSMDHHAWMLRRLESNGWMAVVILHWKTFWTNGESIKYCLRFLLAVEKLVVYESFVRPKTNQWPERLRQVAEAQNAEQPQLALNQAQSKEFATRLYSSGYDPSSSVSRKTFLYTLLRVEYALADSIQARDRLVTNWRLYDHFIHIEHIKPSEFKSLPVGDPWKRSTVYSNTNQRRGGSGALPIYRDPAGNEMGNQANPTFWTGGDNNFVPRLGNLALVYGRPQQAEHIAIYHIKKNALRTNHQGPPQLAHDGGEQQPAPLELFPWVLGRTLLSRDDVIFPAEQCKLRHHRLVRRIKQMYGLPLASDDDNKVPMSQRLPVHQL